MTPRLPEWASSLLASICLHLLLAGGLVFFSQIPREVIWVNLLEARLVPVTKSPTKTPHPDKQSRLLHTSSAIESGKRNPPPAISSLPSHPEFPTVMSHATASLSSSEDGGEISPADTLTEGEDLKTGPSEQDINASEQKVALVETAEQQYVREQFAYIRDRVMDRLIYPLPARRLGWRGEVRVKFTMRGDGTIEDLRVVVSSGRTLLDQQALRAVEAAAPFPPPPASAVIVLPVLFTLGDPGR